MEEDQTQTIAPTESGQRVVVQHGGLSAELFAFDPFYVEHLTILRALPIHYKVTADEPLARIELRIYDRHDMLLFERELWSVARWGRDATEVDAWYTWDGATFPATPIRVDHGEELTLEDLEFLVKVLPGPQRGLVAPADAPLTIELHACVKDRRSMGRLEGLVEPPERLVPRVSVRRTIGALRAIPRDLGAGQRQRLRVVWCLPKTPPSREAAVDWLRARLARCPVEGQVLTLVVAHECFIDAVDVDGFATLMKGLLELSQERKDVVLVPGSINWKTPWPALIDFSRENNGECKTSNGSKMLEWTESEGEFSPARDPRLCCSTCHNTAPVVFQGEAFFVHKLGNAGTIKPPNPFMGHQVRQLTLHQVFRPEDRPQSVLVAGWRIVVEICYDHGDSRCKHGPRGHVHVVPGSGGAVHAESCHLVDGGYGVAADTTASTNRVIRVVNGQQQAAFPFSRQGNDHVEVLEADVLFALETLLDHP